MESKTCYETDIQTHGEKIHLHMPENGTLSKMISNQIIQLMLFGG